MKPYYSDNYVTIYHGDCREILPTLEKVDLVLTSPPYDGLRDYGGYEWDIVGVSNLLSRVLVPGGVIVWVVGDSVTNGSESGNSFRQCLAFMEHGLNLHDTMIYAKNGTPYSSPNRYNQEFEFMFVLSDGKPKTFNPLLESRLGYKKKTFSTYRQKDGTVKAVVPKLRDEGPRGNIWWYDVGYMKSAKEGYIFEHPAIFPEYLANDHILSWSNVGELILDPFLGSGTTAYCAKKLNRKCIGIEIEEKYCEIAAKRCSQGVMELAI